MAHLSNPRIDFGRNRGHDCGMRFVLLTLPILALTCCTSFPQVDAAVPKTIGPRPALLSQAQLMHIFATDIPLADGSVGEIDELRKNALDLRKR